MGTLTAWLIRNSELWSLARAVVWDTTSPPACSQDGYDVLAVSRTQTDELSTLGERGAATELVDLTKPDQIARLIRDHSEFFESMTLLVNNASDFGPTVRTPEAIATDFERYFRIHMLAPFLLGEAFQERSSHDADCSIINLTDIFAERASPVFDIYCATKAGLANLTASQAVRYAPHIRVNAIAPGPVLWGAHHKQSTKDAILKQTPLAREGGAGSIYGAVSYLASARFVTGVTIRVDGGRFHAYAPALDG